MFTEELVGCKRLILGIQVSVEIHVRFFYFCFALEVIKVEVPWSQILSVMYYHPMSLLS